MKRNPEVSMSHATKLYRLNQSWSTFAYNTEWHAIEWWSVTSQIFKFAKLWNLISLWRHDFSTLCINLLVWYHAILLHLQQTHGMALWQYLVIPCFIQLNICILNMDCSTIDICLNAIYKMKLIGFYHQLYMRHSTDYQTLCKQIPLGTYLLWEVGWIIKICTVEGPLKWCTILYD